MSTLKSITACSVDANFIMKSRMRENCTYGSVRGLYCKV
nr:MAG TPA: hypothetical protein [Caudoviricetes sp.]